MGEGKTLILPQRIALSPYPATVTYKRHWVQKSAYTTRQGDAVTGERYGGLGARRAVPAVEAECRLSAQKGDHRRKAPQWARRADSGRSRGRNRAARFDPKRPLGSCHGFGRCCPKSDLRLYAASDLNWQQSRWNVSRRR